MVRKSILGILFFAINPIYNGGAFIVSILILVFVSIEYYYKPYLYKSEAMVEYIANIFLFFVLNYYTYSYESLSFHYYFPSFPGCPKCYIFAISTSFFLLLSLFFYIVYSKMIRNRCQGKSKEN